MFSLSCDVEHAVAKSSSSCWSKRLVFQSPTSSCSSNEMRVHVKFGDVHSVENFVLCLFAHQVCSPLLQGGLARRGIV